MKLPNREKAYIPPSKLIDYLLSETHVMINELNIVALTHDVVDYRLKAGDVGTVVHCYDDGFGFEVEFVTGEGKTVAVLTLTTADIRPFNRAEILHVREVEPVLA